MRNPFAAPVIEQLHQRRKAPQSHRVGRNHRPQPHLAQCVDRAKYAHPQPVFALRPAAVVGRETAVLADHARVAQRVGRRGQFPVLQE
ncbi:MAG: hypothetical protein EBY24_19265 [Betaproteobacteria bacterium]|nr:hypothetical protein [Betaproteobacteria bacterium]